MNFRNGATENRIHGLRMLQSGNVVQLFGVVVHRHAAVRTNHFLDLHRLYLPRGLFAQGTVPIFALNESRL
jgi:hypothetical protein